MGMSRKYSHAHNAGSPYRSEEHTSELQSQSNLVCRLLLEKKKRSPKPTASYARSRLLGIWTSPPPGGGRDSRGSSFLSGRPSILAVGGLLRRPLRPLRPSG